MEDEIRAFAMRLLDGQLLDREGRYKLKKDEDGIFYNAIKGHIETISINPVGRQHCKICEQALCGICGKCHELDKEFIFIGRPCPASVANTSTSDCVAWTYAYIWLQASCKRFAW